MNSGDLPGPVMAVPGAPSLPGVEGGHGRPIVFLHGYPLNHAIWEPQLPLLAAGHHLAMLDLPGYGAAQDHTPPDTMGGFAENVYATIASRFPGKVVLVGHSFGGYIALELMRQHAEKFEALVLTDTRSGADSPEVRAKRLATVERLADPTQGLDIDGTVRSLLAPETWEAQGPLIPKLRTIVLDALPSTIIASLKAIAGRADLTSVLGTIAVPTLVVWGEDDQLIPPDQSEAMVPKIPGAVGVEIPAAGHLPFLEAPHSFARPVMEFLTRLPPP